MAVIPPNLLPEINDAYESDEELNGEDDALDLGDEEAAEQIENMPPINVVGFEPIVPLTDEIMDEYIDDIQKTFNQLKDIVCTLEDCEMAIQALENILIPNCEYLVAQAKKLPQDLEQAVLDIAQHINKPEEHVVSSQHTQEYIRVVELNINNELHKLGLFAQHLQQKRQEENAEKERMYQKAADDYNALVATRSTAQIEIELFRFSVELLSRGTTPPNTSISPTLEKLGGERISAKDLNLLTQSALNCLVFDGASREALEIVDELVAVVRSNRAVMSM